MTNTFETYDEFEDSVTEGVRSVMNECHNSNDNVIIELCLINFYQDGEAEFYHKTYPDLSDSEVQENLTSFIQDIIDA